MAKILGLDLGTNSIGWAIRETEEQDNQIVDNGVVIFQKGVGDGKSGEFSLAAERRKNRSKRRLYNAKRYRKWELLKVLIENGMCPLTDDELRLWSIGNLKDNVGEFKNKRIYPIDNKEFQDWLAFDPAIFGHKGISDNGKPIRKNPYDLRCELIENEEQCEYLQKLKIGRALYHLVQRRGFKSSRKNGEGVYGKDSEYEEWKADTIKPSVAKFYVEKLNNGERIRARKPMQRSYVVEDDFKKICKIQKLSEELSEKLYKAIYFVRPLRSQKGLVGNCTIEKGKPRIPISHPKFEEFRALQFINNIKWREKDQKEFVEIPMSLKKKILEELFFKKLIGGKNKGKVTTDNYFKFEEIIKNYSQNGEYEFNYKNLPNVSTCPTIASLMNVFDEEWKDKFIRDENTYGINWESLSINYTVKYGNKAGQNRILKIDEIWHLLFDYIQTKDKEDDLKKFCQDVLGFDENKTKSFSEIDIPQGYGSLSYKAISKILPFLQSGFIYSEAVLFANLKKVLGEKFEENREQAKKLIAKTIKEIGETKEILNIVNGLIKKFFGENEFPKPIGLENKTVIEAYQKEVKAYLPYYFGEKDWNKKTDNEREKLEKTIFELYSRFLNGEQRNEEKATEKATIDYYKLPRLDEAIKQCLKDNFKVSDSALKHLYHPSDIEMYPISRIGKLESPQPPSKGWKNPMAMRTLHELRHLLNYLLKVGKIDKNTKIVVEMARELNDANKRWAIQTYQRYREEENKEFAKAIVGVAKEKYPNLNENDIENINKVRLWWEQIENSEEVYKQIKALKEDVEKYRLWKEQDCVCMYTGKTINLTNLFDGTQTHFEHTFPASISFDNSLANKTVCDASYNMNIKKDKIPTQLDNYSREANGFSAIEPRLKKWREKEKSLKERIDKIKTRGLDPENKNLAVQKKRLLQLEYDYWHKKVETFTLTEIPAKWKNSQLVDTQIISKYARAYLKTVFEKVDVQKGTVVNDFKKIYQIKGDEQKDRSKHSHHAVDAAVLTLIPNSAKREAILEEYYKADENYQKFYAKPYETYKVSHLLDIENNVIINHIPHDKTLTATIKNIRKRGEKTGWIAQGDSIRGQLHKETFFGAVKALERNEQGFPIKENGKYKTIKNKNGDDEIWIVSRKPIKDIKIEKDIIVDELLKQHIQKQLDSGSELSNVVDFNNKTIRHIRIRVKAGVGFLSKDKAMPIKTQTYISKHKHKGEYLAQNETNYLFLLYEGIDNKGKIIRSYRILNLFEIAQLKIKNIKQIEQEPEFQTIKKGNFTLPLKVILKAGDKVIFFKDSKEEIAIENAKLRLFKLYKFNEMGSPFLYFQNHIEARPDSEIEKTESVFDSSKYQARLMLVLDKLNCLFEGKDFEIKPDGTITFK
jgi:CRISPR-associated endonuclease Csn1